MYTNWADAGKEGAAPAVVAATAAAAAKYRFGPLVIALGVAQDAAGGGVRSTVEWSGARSVPRGRHGGGSRPEARVPRPGCGVEPALHVRAGRIRGFHKGLRGRVRRDQAGLARHQGLHHLPARAHARVRAGKLDLIGYTTYPFLGYAGPGDLADDYYADAARRSPAPVAFTEIGWPSADLGGAAAGSPYGGTPEEQAAFVSRFFELTRAVRPALALWSFPNDVGAGGPPTFSSLSLRRNDGTAKPALAAWQTGIGTK
ncbi:MAG TPA: hypothetical protein VGR87_03690 [Candidatus Limnocylindria bacterium]|nr:hypothetical protein [Candidatus Limnocylindria bacterium]